MKEKIWEVEIKAEIRNFDVSGDVENKAAIADLIRNGMNFDMCAYTLGEFETNIKLLKVALMKKKKKKK